MGVVAIGRNEGERLKRCLRSAIAATDRVVYVDSGSTDGSCDFARSLGVEVLDLDTSVPFTAARARNAGIARLTERWPDLAFVQVVDGDCEFAEGWIAHALDFMREHSRCACACGRRRERNPDASIYNHLIELEWDTPVGEAKACGGDALFRLEPFRAAGGYRDTLIAGEEPELCVRLRAARWTVHRLDHEMTRHDAAMTRFSQFWKRAKRAGHAYAEGAALHGRGPDRHGVRGTRSAILWGLVLPLLAVLLAWWTLGGSLVALVGLYALQMFCVRAMHLRRGRSARDATMAGVFTMLAKPAQASGVLLYWRRRLTGQRSTLIEYKGADAATPPKMGEAPVPESPVILYMSGTVPKRSETFVYREILALRELGVDVRTASVHAPTRAMDDNGPLSRMAEETVEVYSKGVVSLMAACLAELVTRPIRTVGTMGLCKLDAFFSRDVPMSRRLSVAWQGVAGVALARRVRLMNVAHVHCHMAHVPTTIGMYAARQLGVTFSFTGHANDLFPNRTLLTEKLHRALWVNCISEWHRDFYRRSIVDRPDADYPIVRCGVDTRKHPVTPASRGECLEVLGVGRLVEKKGFDVLIQAAGDLARAGGAKVRVRIAGCGEEEAALRALVAQLPALAEVELLGDTDNDTVMELMGRVDVFALPCRVAQSGDRDGIPVVLMEAMLRGRCVISGDLETIRELVRDGQTGVMIPPGDRRALLSVLGDLARDRNRIDELGRAARARVEEEFDLMRNAERIVTAMRAHGVLPGRDVS